MNGLDQLAEKLGIGIDEIVNMIPSYAQMCANNDFFWGVFWILIFVMANIITLILIKLTDVDNQDIALIY